MLGVKSGGSYASFQNLLPVESHKRHLIPLTMNGDGVSDMLPTGKLVRD